MCTGGCKCPVLLIGLPLSYSLQLVCDCHTPIQRVLVILLKAHLLTHCSIPLSYQARIFNFEKHPKSQGRRLYMNQIHLMTSEINLQTLDISSHFKCLTPTVCMTSDFCTVNLQIGFCPDASSSIVKPERLNDDISIELFFFPQLMDHLI